METTIGNTLPHKPIRVIFVYGLIEIRHLKDICWSAEKRVPLLLLAL
jgi:hypothetical protein